MHKKLSKEAVTEESDRAPRNWMVLPVPGVDSSRVRAQIAPCIPTQSLILEERSIAL